MKRKLQGKYVTVSTVGERVKAFVPTPLPPAPDIDWTVELREKFNQAYLALGRLDSIAAMSPDMSLLLYMYVRKEAVLSSMIEGTQSSLADLLIYELKQQPGVPVDDVEEVSNYVAALNHGMQRLEQGLPLSVRLMKELHAVLLSGGRGSTKQPGTLRKSQNWVGGTRPGNAVFVPPPPELIAENLSELEKFLHDQNRKTPTLVKAALAHVQFETIHPFLDGNGRLGRLLITLILVSEKLLQQPLLYLSLYFKTYRQQYYELLEVVRSTGDWESWLEFFAEAVVETAGSAVSTTRLLMEQMENDRTLIKSQGRVTGTLVQLHEALQVRPITTSSWLQQKTGLAAATIQTGLQRLEKLGLVKELTGKLRDRIYSYQKYIAILNQGNDLP